MVYRKLKTTIIFAGSIPTAEIIFFHVKHIEEKS